MYSWCLGDHFSHATPMVEGLQYDFHATTRLHSPYFQPKA